MKNNTSLKTLVLAASLALGLSAHAQTDQVTTTQSPTSLGNQGLLGQSYATLSYSYLNSDDSPIDADNYHFEINHPFTDGFDAFLSYDFTQSEVFAGDRAKQDVLGAGVRAFSPRYSWGKPYAEVGAGYAWNRFAGQDDNSWFWEVAVGVEFQVAARATVTPYVQYLDAPDIRNGDQWNYGVKGNYWVGNNWSVLAGVERDDDQNMAYTIGTNFRF